MKEPKPLYNKELLFHSAKGFLDIEYHLAREVKREEPIKGFQRLATAIVNFSFATELMIKGLHLLTTKKQLKTHSFWNIYNALPDKLKDDIETDFKQNRVDLDEELTSHKITITKADEKSSRSESTEINDVKDLLMLHNKSFEYWRYIYEIKHGGYEYEYNFP